MPNTPTTGFSGLGQAVVDATHRIMLDSHDIASAMRQQQRTARLSVGHLTITLTWRRQPPTYSQAHTRIRQAFFKPRRPA